MILMGDECRRTQRGNNNAYCQDNAISWFNWKLVRKNAVAAAVPGGAGRLPPRRAHAPPVELPHRPAGEARRAARRKLVQRPGNRRRLDVGPAEPGLPAGGRPAADAVLLAAITTSCLLCHAGPEPQPFLLPPLTRDLPWRQFVNTAARPPADVYPDLEGPEFPADGVVILEARSLVCYVAPDLQ